MDVLVNAQGVVVGSALEVVLVNAVEVVLVSVVVFAMENARVVVLELVRERALALVRDLVAELQDVGSRNMKEKNITLVITHQCNLNCIYCYEKHKDDKIMSFECAIKIVTENLAAKDKYDFIEFDFLGGEPFLEFDLMKKIVDEIKNKEWSKKYIFFATTNGTILKEEWKQWLIDNRKYFQVALSLDGTPEMQNINRCNSYKLIDIDFFINTYPDQPVKMTISQKTLCNLALGNIYFLENNINYTCNFAYGIDWSKVENESLLKNEILKILDYYNQNPDKVPIGLLNPERIINISAEKNKTFRVCGAGYDNIAYDYDGQTYPCQFFLPLSVGDEKAKEAKKLSLPQKIIKDSTYACNKCILRNVCFICLGSNYASNGDIFSIDKNMCKLFKLQFKATAKLVSLMFENGTLEENYGDSAKWLVKSAIMINDEL